MFPSLPGKVRHDPGFPVKALANANCRASAGSPAHTASHVALVAKVIGMVDAAGAVAKAECMLFSGLHRGGQGQDRPKSVSDPDVAASFSFYIGLHAQASREWRRNSSLMCAAVAYHFASPAAQPHSSQPYQTLVEHLPPTHSSLAT